MPFAGAGHCAGGAACRRYLQGGRAFRGGYRHRALRQGAGAVAGAAAAAIAARLVCGLFAVVLLLAVPPPVFADELSGELPKSTRDILDEGGTDLSDAARWRFSDLCDTVGAWAAEGLQPALHLAAQSAGYLLLAGAAGPAGRGPVPRLCGDPRGARLWHAEPFRCHAADRTCRRDGAGLPHLSDCLCAGIQRPGRRRWADVRGRLSIAACFLPCPGFFQPSSKSCFCLSCSCISALRSRPACGTTPAWGMLPRCFSRCLHWLLKGCGALFSLVLGLQKRTGGHGGQCGPADRQRGYCRVSFPLSGTPQPRR